MKALRKALGGRKVLAFMDLEATQFSHEIIEIGLIKVLINDDLTVKKALKGLKVYVKPKGKIGDLVSRLTGITEDRIEKEGVRFARAQKMVEDYLGKDYRSCLFVTYGNQDAMMFIAPPRTTSIRTSSPPATSPTAASTSRRSSPAT